jgi:isocitrate lyase
MTEKEFSDGMTQAWRTSPRWAGIVRPYTAADVYMLQGSVRIEHSLARLGAERLWTLLQDEPYVHVLSAITGNQAIQNVRAGLKAIYASGWQVAADGNNALQMYPDQSLYPSDSVPLLIRRLNNALLRADQVHHLKRQNGTHWMAPIVADAEAGFGGPLHAFEIMKDMIAEGAAGVHFEDQLASVKKCGHLGGKVLVPTREFVTKLVAARLAADVSGVPTILIARTDANSAGLLTSDIDPADAEFLTGTRTHEGFFGVREGIAQAIARGLAYAPYADLLWFETARPDLAEARQFADAIHARYAGKLLAYNCSPSFNWRRNLDRDTIARFQRELGEMGYRFQFVTLSAFHALNYAQFMLAQDYRERGMAAYSDLQEKEFAAESDGYDASRHQEFVGTGYFDAVTEVATGGESSVTAMKNSTEAEQFHDAPKRKR